jgi:phenylalanyl-tRNA synthetase beta chain
VRRGGDNGGGAIGLVGEVDPAVLGAFGLDPERQRVGWFEVDLELLLGHAHRRPEVVAPVSRFPSSDVDLAFVVDDAVASAEVAGTLRRSGGDLLESVELFDVYRGPGVDPGARSLAYRLRFCALDHTLTDAEVGELRSACIVAVEQTHGAQLRG